MRLHLPRRRLWRVAIYLVCLLLVLVAADLVLVQVRRGFVLSFDTTRIVKPVLPDGRVDYLSYLDEQRGEGVTPENNAAVPFLLAVGRLALPSTQPVDGITDKLGMAHLPEKGDYLVRYNDFLKQHEVGVGAGKARDLPELGKTWPVKIDALTAQWVKANEGPMELLVAGSKRSRFFIPFDGGNRPEVIMNVVLPHLRVVREMGQLLLLRAMMRLEAGDVAGFERDLLAVHRWARLLAQSMTAVERAMAAVLDGHACEAGRLAAMSGKLSADQARSLAGELAALGDLPPVSEVINGERFMVLDILGTLATELPDRGANLFNEVMANDGMGPPNFWFRFMPLPYEAAMRQTNHCYDGALAALSLPDYPRRTAAINLWGEENARNIGGPFLIFKSSSSFALEPLLISIRGMEDREETARAQMRLTEIALALAAFRLEHGGYPHALDELVPGYLAAVPNDPFSEKGMVYGVTAKGYALRSVGPNMTDDDGVKDDIAADVP
jgi:hypothetical protein